MYVAVTSVIVVSFRNGMDSLVFVTTYFFIQYYRYFINTGIIELWTLLIWLGTDCTEFTDTQCLLYYHDIQINHFNQMNCFDGISQHTDELFLQYIATKNIYSNCLISCYNFIFRVTPLCQVSCYCSNCWLRTVV